MAGLVWRLARRDLRGGARSLRILVLCLCLGVGAIVAVGSVSASIKGGLADNARDLLGGDIEAEFVHQEPGPQERAALEALGRTSTVRTLRAMVRKEDDSDATLVEAKAVDARYPLSGRLETEPATGPAALFAERDGVWGAAAAPDLLDRMGLRPGDRLKLGDARIEIRARLSREPDESTGLFNLGPRLMVGSGALDASGLIRLGSLYNAAVRVVLPAGSDAAAAGEALANRFPDAGWRLRNLNNASASLQQFIDRLVQFLTLAGLASLAIGGVGVATAISAYMDGKTRTIAVMKSLGTRARTIFATYLAETLTLAACGILVGLVLGSLAPFALARTLGAALPAPLRLGVYPAPLALGALYGLAVTLIFTLPALSRAMQVTPARLFRSETGPPPRIGRRVLALEAVLALLLAAVTVATSGDPATGLWFVGGLVGLFLVLLAVARGIAAAAGRLRAGAGFAPRLALGHLEQPAGAARDAILALGLGLALLVTLVLVERNLRQELDSRIPVQAPTFFFVDIQPDEIDAFRSLVQGTPGTADLATVPSLRGRVVRVNDTPAEKWPIAPDGRWILRGDRGVTYADAVPEGSSLTAGRWWPRDYRGEPLLSFDAKLAQAMGIGIGDRLTVNVLGRDVEARIASLRQIDWSSLGINFTLIFSPNAFAGAPHSYLATVRADATAEAGLFRAVTTRFPNVSVIRVCDAIERADGLLTRLGLGIAAAGGVAVATGAIVLAGAFSAGQRRRLREAVLLKLVGARRSQVRRAFLIEYALIGLATGVVAAVAANAAAWGVLAGLMKSDWHFQPVATAAGVVIGLLLSIGLGSLSGRRLWSVPAARVLHEN